MEFLAGLGAVLSGLGTFIMEHLGTVILILIFSGLVTFFIVGITIEGNQINQSGIPQNGFSLLNTLKNGFMGLLGLQ